MIGAILPSGSHAPDEAEDVVAAGRGVGRSDLGDGHVFLSTARHLPNTVALRVRVRNTALTLNLSKISKHCFEIGCKSLKIQKGALSFSGKSSKIPDTALCLGEESKKFPNVALSLGGEKVKYSKHCFEFVWIMFKKWQIML